MRAKFAEDYYIRVLLQKARIADVMTSPSIAIDVDEPFSRVPQVFNSHHIRHLPVINKDKKLVGLITQSDLYKIQPPRKLETGEWYYDEEALNNVELGRVMNTELFTLTPDQAIAQALEAMVKEKYGCVPIVDSNNVLVGILTQYDFLKMAVDILEEGAGKEGP